MEGEPREQVPWAERPGRFPLRENPMPVLVVGQAMKGDIRDLATLHQQGKEPHPARFIGRVLGKESA